MIGKTLIAAAIAATFAVAAPTPQAKADVDVDIGIGIVPGYYAGGYSGGGYYGGGGYYAHGYGDYDAYDGYGDGHYRDRPYNHRISCSKGSRIVANAGFHRVRAVDCDLPGYRYAARKNGKKYMVRVNGRGNITDISRVY